MFVFFKKINMGFSVIFSLDDVRVSHSLLNENATSLLTNWVLNARLESTFGLFYENWSCSVAYEQG